MSQTTSPLYLGTADSDLHGAPPPSFVGFDVLCEALIRLTSCEAGSDEYAACRAAIAELVGSTNTYSTWSIALKQDNVRNTPLFYRPGSKEPDVTPAECGVEPLSTPEFLKGLDLGGGDQRKLNELLSQGFVGQAEDEVLLANKKGGSNRTFILTSGSLAMRLESCALLSGASAKFAEPWRFVVLAPEDEGRLTAAASEAELRRLLRASQGKLTHALLVAKGSTDLHLAYLDAERGIASAAGCVASQMHQPSKTEPSRAIELFDEYVARDANAPLRAACAAGTCAIVLAGASVHAVGRQLAATGNYFRRAARAEVEATDLQKAAFERHVTLGTWSGSAMPNAVFFGAISAHKPRLDGVVC